MTYYVKGYLLVEARNPGLQSCLLGQVSLFYVRALERFVKPSFKAILIFVAGAVLGVFATDFAYNHLGRQVQQALQFAALSQARQEAEAAYFQRSPEIAEWELTKLVPRLSIPAVVPYYTIQDRNFALFLTHARLAKLEQAEGKQAEAEKNLAAARDAMKTLFSDYPKTEGDAVFSLLARIDQPPKPR
jgi:hypothetical protein